MGIAINRRERTRGSGLACGNAIRIPIRAGLGGRSWGALRLSIVAALFCALGLTACNSGGGGGGGGARLGAAIIGSGGGTVTSADGNATLTIPPGALGNTETITIEPVDPATLPPEFAGANVQRVYKLGPDGTRFALPVTVSVMRTDEQPVQADGSLSGTEARLITSSNGALEPLGEPGITLDGSTNTTTVTGLLGHFSYVAMLELPQGSSPLPRVWITDLPPEMLVNAAVDVFVKIDIGELPEWGGTASFYHDVEGPPLEFTGVDSEPISAGVFFGPGGAVTSIETKVGRQVCIASSSIFGGTGDRVVLLPTPLPGTGGGGIGITYVKAQAVRCTHVLGGLPTVTLVSPNMATDVPIDTAFRVDFSEEMDPLSILGAFRVLDSAGHPIEGSIEIGPAGDFATFQPTVSLAPGSVYHVEVTTLAKDIAGNAMADPFLSTFTTAATTGNTVRLSGTTGGIPQVNQTPPCFRAPGPGPGEMGMVCGEPGTLILQLIYDVPTRMLKGVHMGLEVNGTFYLANADCASEPSCSRITTGYQGEIIDWLTISDFQAHFTDAVTGLPAGSGFLTADIRRFQF